ncbi:MAG: AI-2E family transporter [Terriglobales bacterium]
MIPPTLITPNKAVDSSRLLMLIAVAVVIVGLYFGREVLIPLALAVVLAFVFTPVVGGLQKCHLGRVPAVLVVLLLAFTVIGTLGWVVTGQLMDIVDQLPNYEDNIHAKIESLRVPDGSRLKNATNTVNALGAELSAASQPAADKKTTTTSRGRPIAVQVAQPPSNANQYLRAIIGPLTGVFETSAMVIVFTLFMLVKREDLRNRVIRLAGQQQLHVVTQALDDASRRLSRYLLMQFLVNITYGTAFGSAAYLIGIPHALLWGVLSGILRFVPYVGTPIAAAFPMGMALAVFPGWQQAGLIFGVFVVLEIVVANVVEPRLYGAHTGISSLAILVAAVFWATLWGPVGLMLSTPLTVCLILMGRYVPQLTFLEILLGDEPVLPVEAHFYQRLLALDQEEARAIAESQLREKPIGDFYDSILIPALMLAEQDRHLDMLGPGIATFISQSTRELIEEVGERPIDIPFMFNGDKLNGRNAGETVLSGLRVVCIGAGDEADELVTMMFEQLLKRLGCSVRRLPHVLHGTVVDQAAVNAAQVVVVSALPPFAVGQARSLCKLLRQRHPQLKMILGLWGFKGGVAKARERVGSSSADMVATSFQQAIVYLVEAQQSIGSRKRGAIQEQVIATAP